MQDKLIEFMDVLCADQRITCLERRQVSSGASKSIAEMNIRVLNERLKVTLPIEYIDYIRIKDVGMSWRADNDVTGEFDLQPLKFVLSSSDETQLWHDEMSEEEIEFYESLQTIDLNSFSGSGLYTAFRMIEGEFPPEIWFVNRDAKFQLDLDYGQYLNALMELRGMHGWQYFFLKDYEKLKSDSYDLNRAKSHMTDSITGLRELFPEIDRTKYEAIYNDLFTAN